MRSAVNIHRLPQSVAPNFSGGAAAISRGIESIGAAAGQARRERQEEEKRALMMDKAVGLLNPPSPLEKQTMLQSEAVELEREQAVMGANVQANEKQRILQENSNMMRILNDPENKRALLELMDYDKNLAQGVLNMAKAGDTAQMAQVAAQAQEAMQFFGNYQAMAAQHGKDKADELLLMPQARKVMQANGGNPDSIQNLLDMKNADSDTAMAMAQANIAKAGGVLKVPEVQRMTAYQQAQDQNADADRAQRERRLAFDREKFEAEQLARETKGPSATELKAEEEQKDLNNKYKAFSVAFTDLNNALSETMTGPIVGALPATSENQRVAEGAVKNAANALKKIIRGAGEGTFTDADQKFLIEQIPNRYDEPEVAQKKTAIIERTLRAQLGISDEIPAVFQGNSESNRDQLIRQAQEALSRGADPDAVAARLKEMGVE
jgi:hypothetical protein